MNESLRAQLAELATVHKGLIKIDERAGITSVSGALTFDVTPPGLEQIIDSFDVEIRVPYSYPKDLPEVIETGGRIDEGYPHRNPGVGTMCLGAPVEVRLAFMEEPTLLGYVNRLVIPFLYGHAFWYRHGRHPFGELAHGGEGIAQYYIRRLVVPNEVMVLEFLSLMIEHGYRGHHNCPCGSRKRLRECHGDRLRTLLRAHTEKSLVSDLLTVFSVCIGKAKRGELVIPGPLWERFERIKKRVLRESATQTEASQAGEVH